MSEEKPTNIRGWVLYDDTCGFCRSWVPLWKETLNKRGFDIAPLQADWVMKSYNLPIEQLINDFRLLLADGTKIQGAEVYRYLMKHIWWAYPIYLLSIVPGLRFVFDKCYQKFAKNRYGVSRVCGLPGKDA